MNLGDHLQQLYDTHGRLDGELLVAQATPKGHELHGRFEWDNRVAGHRYRLAQAQDLIRSVKIAYRDNEDGTADKVRRYVSVRSPEGSTSYRPTAEVAEDPFTAQLVLREAEREWKAMRRRYGHLEAFMQLVQRDVNGGQAA